MKHSDNWIMCHIQSHFNILILIKHFRLRVWIRFEPSAHVISYIEIKTVEIVYTQQYRKFTAENCLKSISINDDLWATFASPLQNFVFFDRSKEKKRIFLGNNKILLRLFHHACKLIATFLVQTINLHCFSLVNEPVNPSKTQNLIDDE